MNLVFHRLIQSLNAGLRSKAISVRHSLLWTTATSHKWSIKCALQAPVFLGYPTAHLLLDAIIVVYEWAQVHKITNHCKNIATQSLGWSKARKYVMAVKLFFVLWLCNLQMRFTLMYIVQSLRVDDSVCMLMWLLSAGYAMLTLWYCTRLWNI